MRTKREPANAAHARCWCNGKGSIQPSLFLPKSGEAWRPLAVMGRVPSLEKRRGNHWISLAGAAKRRSRR